MDCKYKIKWTDEKVIEEICKVKEALGLNRMPSRSEIDLVRNDTALTSKISRAGGFYHWAKKLNLNVKDSETSFGDLYEQKVKRKLEELNYKVERMGVRHPYDLLVNDNVKIDVKVAKPFTSEKTGTFHTFNLEKQNPTCDIYVAIALTNNNEVERVFVIPSKYLKITQLSVGKASIYDKYIDKWGYIKKYDEFYKSVI